MFNRPCRAKLALKTGLLIICLKNLRNASMSTLTEWPHMSTPTDLLKGEGLHNFVEFLSVGDRAPCFQICTKKNMLKEANTCQKGHCPSADLRYGDKYSISPSTHIFSAIKGYLGLYILYIPPNVWKLIG